MGSSSAVNRAEHGAEHDMSEQCMDKGRTERGMSIASGLRGPWGKVGSAWASLSNHIRDGQ
jgi:hypothetical protein